MKLLLAFAVSGAALAGFCVSEDISGTVPGEVGLWGRRVTYSWDGGLTAWDRDVMASRPGLEDWDRCRTIGPLAAYAVNDARWPVLEPADGQTFWRGNGVCTFSYVGYMHFTAGEPVRFRVSNSEHNNSYVLVDDATEGSIGAEFAGHMVLEKVGKCKDAEAEYVAPLTGWHAVRFSFGRYYGFVGDQPDDGILFSRDGGASWSKLIDPGDGSLFRVAPADPLQLAPVRRAGDEIRGVAKAAVTLAGYTLYACFSDGATPLKFESWTTTAFEGSVATNGEKRTFAAKIPAGAKVFRMAAVRRDDAGAVATCCWTLPVEIETAPAAADLPWIVVGAKAGGKAGDMIGFVADVRELEDGQEATVEVRMGLLNDLSDAKPVASVQVRETGPVALKAASEPETNYFYTVVVRSPSGKEESLPAMSVKTNGRTLLNENGCFASDNLWRARIGGEVSRLGAGETVVTLRLGETPDALADAVSMTVGADGRFTFEREFPYVGKDVAYSFRVSNSCSRAVWTQETKPRTFHLADRTAYFWSPDVKTGAWREHDGWTNAKGEALDARCVAPLTFCSDVSFARCTSAEDPVRVTLDGELRAKAIDLSGGARLVFGERAQLMAEEISSSRETEESEDATLEFRVPAGGYGRPVISNRRDVESPWAFAGNSCKKIRLAVADDSPAFASGESVSTIVEWASCIEKEYVVFQKGPKGDRSRFFYTYGWKDGHTTDREKPEETWEYPTGIKLRVTAP